jgi:hypothetical protein
MDTCAYDDVGGFLYLGHGSDSVVVMAQILFLN